MQAVDWSTVAIGYDWGAEGVLVLRKAGAVIGPFTTRGAAELLLLVVNSLSPVSCVGDTLAVASVTLLVFLCGDSDVVVPTVPTVLPDLVVTHWGLHSDQRGQPKPSAQARGPLPAVGETFPSLRRYHFNSLVLATVRATGGGRAGVGVHGNHRLDVAGAAG